MFILCNENALRSIFPDSFIVLRPKVRKVDIRACSFFFFYPNQEERYFYEQTKYTVALIKSLDRKKLDSDLPVF